MDGDVSRLTDLTAQELLLLTKNALTVLYIIHEEKYMHLDIKPPNILYTNRKVFPKFSRIFRKTRGSELCTEAMRALFYAKRKEFNLQDPRLTDAERKLFYDLMYSLIFYSDKEMGVVPDKLNPAIKTFSTTFDAAQVVCALSRSGCADIDEVGEA
ncbi:hypothetical protein TSOC_006572 [Tetrabaena socialis]|uniref:Protein kinase domain-containing protein n=1 Tax=Tetrabaena socialis TaxID=47790 RepID=A0A2J8A3A9_9CHLO|nr:hypothetical protein TSOC_006572 [Tetrabaena socialis]|eukprot:PNH07015.1 hypothetical protein TSOC_006572 [Tetrabaena socialis]